MVNPHEPLGAMGPIDWDEVPHEDLKEFLEDVFSETQAVIESIPAPATRTTMAPTGRARSKTESAAGDSLRPLSQRQKASSIAQSQELRKEWREIKVNPRENPLEINVYKLAAKDGRGAWFARRSVHEGLAFDDWEKGLEMEFTETMKVQGSPGSGKIRGIGADKRVEHQTVQDVGQLQVFQLSAQFPGPTAPRDFITLLLTSESSFQTTGGSRPLRQFMMVSKPCGHPECPPRQGVIRGYYESVEIVREILTDPVATRRSLSSADLGRDEASRRGAAGNHESTPSIDGVPVAIEWIMVTRSDPGGSVPRFLIEKGTPPGIIGDAGKFLKWVTAKSAKGFEKPELAEADDVMKETEPSDSNSTNVKTETPEVPRTAITNVNPVYAEQGHDDSMIPSSNGLYGIITGAFGAASSLVASGFLRIGGTYSDVSNDSMSDAHTMEEHHEEKHHNDDTVSDASSVRSFASALEKSVTADRTPESTTESQSETSRSNPSSSQQDKELKKLQERRRKLDEKVVKFQQRRNSKMQGEKEKDAATTAKLREKHEREIAKQEEKYRKEMRKLEEKRENERRKSEDRRRKAQEREEKANLTLELEKVRAGRDLAHRQIELLEAQVGELQAQNTMLVRKLGKMGMMDRSDSDTSFKSHRDPDAKAPMATT